MEPERLRDDQEEDQERPRDHPMRRLPSFSKAVRQLLAFNSLQSTIAVSLEPLLRRVVREEVQRSLDPIRRNLGRHTEMQITSSPEAPLYQLIIKRPPKTPIFSGAKIQDQEGNPLQILLAVGPTGSPCSSGQSPIKVELVVLDGDFPSRDDWTSAEFEKAIVKERAGRRPLLTGDVTNSMRDGVATTGDIQFTDNSSWIRSRHFRIGVRVVPGSFEHTVIKETMTERFTVKDHRGELHRKHYPPVLRDAVWRLEKIGKDGAFHKKLSENNIHSVQDFLKLLTVDPGQLHQILNGMKENMWERVIKHALTCNLGNKIYFYCGQNFVIFLNSICQVVHITIGGIPFTLKDLPNNYRDYVQQLIREAYEQWDNLREADEFDANVTSIQSQSLVQSGLGPVQWYPKNSQDSGIIEFKGDGDEGSSSSSFQFDQDGSMEWNNEFNQMS